MSYYYESKSDTHNYHYISHKISPFTVLHFHSAVEMVMVRRGRMLAVINGEELVIEAGFGCFADKFCLHSYSQLEEDTEVYALVGSHTYFDSFISDIGGVPPVCFRFDDFDLMDKIVEYYGEAENDRRRSVFKGAVALVLSAIAANNKILPAQREESSGDICDILRYINEHYTEDLSLTSLSSRFGYSPQYFSRLFHRHMNINLTEYVNVARANHARKLLDAKTKKNVAEIAFDSGFSSIPSFYRAYKKVFGELPRG